MLTKIQIGLVLVAMTFFPTFLPKLQAASHYNVQLRTKSMDAWSPHSSYRDFNKAQNEANNLRQLGYKARIISTSGGAGQAISTMASASSSSSSFSSTTPTVGVRRLGWNRGLRHQFMGNRRWGLHHNNFNNRNTFNNRRFVNTQHHARSHMAFHQHRGHNKQHANLKGHAKKGAMAHHGKQGTHHAAHHAKAGGHKAGGHNAKSSGHKAAAHHAKAGGHHGGGRRR